ncbi:MAG TPA: hypothetical protein VL358_04680 [Caulobacteraceae bacterium]|nr:hypothetical protein [Caulobacteraceae bacterium]
MNAVGSDSLFAELFVAAAPGRALDLKVFAWRHGRPWRQSSFEQYEPSEPLPAYTADLQAALDLVEAVRPGLNWIVARGRATALEPLYGAVLLRGQETLATGEHEASAALALLCAMLKLNGRGL